MSPLPFDDAVLIDLLDRAFPELDYPDWFQAGRDLAWIVYESIFAAQLKEALQQVPESSFVTRAFAFIEELARTFDERVSNLLRVGVLETIHSVFPDEEGLIITARRFMGPRALALSDAALTSLGRPIPEADT